MIKFDDEKPELNITPLVDIMLVLMAILMVSAPVIVYDDKISLPVGSSSQLSDAKKQNLIIKIDKNKNVFIGSRNLKLHELPDNLVLLQGYDKNEPVYIRADKSLIYNDVMYVLKSVKSAGFTKVALQTNG